MLDILLVDDDHAARMSVSFALSDSGHSVTEARDAEEAETLLREHVYDVAVFDIRLPKGDGLSLFRKLRQASPGTTVILMTAYAAIPDAVQALREGAYDYVTKPFDPEDFALRVIGRIAERRALRQELEQARAQLVSRNVGADFVGQSPQMVRLVERINTYAQSDAPVLISGEAGTGKELVARMLHEKSPRRERSFVAVNCAAFSDTLLDVELFGAPSRKRGGYFRAAEGGTLFLDEAAAIPLPLQAKIVRVLQKGDLESEHGTIPVDVRIVSATTQNLRQCVAEGRFQEELFYGLNVLDLNIPPLRARKADLPLLLQYFLRKLTPAARVPPGISPAAWEALYDYDYPGNVREFAQAIERALVLAHGSEIDLEHLPKDIIGTRLPEITNDPSSFHPLNEALREFERRYLVRALAMVDGRHDAAADLLGISHRSLLEKLEEHGLVDRVLPQNERAARA